METTTNALIAISSVDLWF